MTVNRAVPNIRSGDPAETRDSFVEALGFGVATDLGGEVRRFMLREPSGTVVNVLSHRSG